MLHGSSRVQLALLVLVMAAASCVLADGVLTPAISVISAVEGLQYNISGLSDGEGRWQVLMRLAAAAAAAASVALQQAV